MRRRSSSAFRIRARASRNFRRIKRLFVVAAHPDDDTIGCGGTIATIAARGGAVHVAYLTDGSASHPGSRRFSRSAVAKLREAEAVTALRELGVASMPDFFRLPDSGLHELDALERTSAIVRLRDSIVAFRPDTIVAPWRRDPHSDHIAAFDLSHAAWVQSRLDVRIAGYDVWTSIFGRSDDLPRSGEASAVTIDLDSSARAAKRRALFAHRSQTSDLIDDDPNGFRISPELAERWLGPSERFFFLCEGTIGSC